MGLGWRENKRRGEFIVTVNVALGAVAGLLGPVAVAQDEDIVIADAHVHLVDFLQNGDYLEDGAIVPKRPRGDARRR